MKFSGFAFFAAFLVIGSVMISCNHQEWQVLFNGEDLEGWTVKCLPADQDKDYWTVQEGSIECNSIGDKDHNRHLLLHLHQIQFRTS